MTESLLLAVDARDGEAGGSLRYRHLVPVTDTIASTRVIVLAPV
jgi:hypothetical protein